MKKNVPPSTPVLLQIKRRLHGLRRGFFLSLALTLTVVGYFHFVGFPQWAIRKVENKLAEREVYVSIEKVKLDFYYGFDAQQVVVYPSPLRRNPLLTADHVAGYLSARELLSGQRLAKFHVNHAAIAPALLPADIRPFVAPPVIESLDGEWRPGKCKAYESTILWGKLRIHAAGDFFYDAGSLDVPGDKKEPGALPDVVLLAGQWLYNSVRLKDPAELGVQFSFNTILPERSQLNLTFDGGRALIRNVFFSDINLGLSLSPEQLNLHTFELRNGSNVLQLSGALGMKDYRAALKINNTLALQDLALLYSDSLAQRLRDEGVELKEGFQVTLKTGADDWLKHQDVSGTLFAKGLTVRGVALQNLYASGKHADGVAEISSLRLHVPAGTVGDAAAPRQVKGGHCTASGLFNSQSKEYQLQTALDFDPWLVLPLLEKTPLEYVVREHEFYDEVNVETSLTGIWGDLASLAVTGRVKAGSAARCGAPVDAALVDFSYQDSLLTLPSIYAEKDGLTGEGMVLINFRSRMIDLDLKGRLDPNEIAKMINPMVSRPVSLFAFNGENDLHCRGAVDYGTWKKTRLQGTYRGTTIRSPVAELEQVSLDFGMTGAELYFTNIQARVYGGNCAGSSSFTVHGADLPYHADLVAANVDLSELAGFYGESDAKNNLGKLSGNVLLQGELGPPVGRNIRGSGSAVIEDGWLVELPALKSFTKVARLVFSSFSTFSQTDCTLDFEIRDGAIHSDNLMLAGDVMTLAGKGRYDFNSGFDALVEMRPFRQNKLTRVVQWATTPFSEVFKFEMQGPLSNPTWHLSRIPDVTSMFKKKSDLPELPELPESSE